MMKSWLLVYISYHLKCTPSAFVIRQCVSSLFPDSKLNNSKFANYKGFVRYNEGSMNIL